MHAASTRHWAAGPARWIDRRNNIDYEDISYLRDDVSRVPRP